MTAVENARLKSVQDAIAEAVYASEAARGTGRRDYVLRARQACAFASLIANEAAAHIPGLREVAEQCASADRAQTTEEQTSWIVKARDALI